MLASDLSAIALTSRLPLKDHVVPMDQLGTAKIAENIRDFTALAADDGLRLLMVVSGEPAPEAPLDARDASRKQALARGECRRRALIHDEGALGLQRACDPALARRHRV